MTSGSEAGAAFQEALGPQTTAGTACDVTPQLESPTGAALAEVPKSESLRNRLISWNRLLVAVCVIVGSLAVGVISAPHVTPLRFFLVGLGLIVLVDGGFQFAGWVTRISHKREERRDEQFRNRETLMQSRREDAVRRKVRAKTGASL